MDDFPAGPASPGPRRPPLSVVIPVRDGGRDLERCLRGLRDSDWADFECLVVDDGSADGSPAVAEAFGARLIRHERPLGPAAARNAGAAAASAPLVFFLDADVVVHPDTIRRVVGHFDSDPSLDALFGSYDDAPEAPGVVSRFRNLLHHYVHQQGDFDGDARPAHTFWTGCGAIKRDAFLAVGGFDPLLYRRPAIEDIELGYRLTRAGYRIALARDVQATHLKRWTLRTVIRTDIFQRGVPWTLLMLRSGVRESDLNVNAGQRLCVAITGLGLLGLAVSPWLPWGLGLLGLNLAANAALNWSFLRFLARRRGARFALASFPLHYLYFVCCGLSVAFALAILARPRRRRSAEAASMSKRGARAYAPAAVIPPAAALRRRERWTRPRP